MTTTTTFTTINDLASDIAERLGLNSAQVREAVSANRQMFGRYEDITAEELDALDRAVWARIVGGSYPF